MNVHHIMIEELVSMINSIKSRFTDDSDMTWSGYNSAKEIRDELDQCADQLGAGDLQCVDNLKVHFLPTSTFQEHSIQNGWSDEYMQLAENFDRIYNATINNR